MRERRTRLQEILDSYVAHGIVGVSRAVSVPGKDDILLASGMADFENDIPVASERVWTPEELVEFAFEVGVRKEPGGAVHWLKGLFGGRVLDRRGLWEMAGNPMPASFPGTPITHNGHGILVFALGDGLVVKGHGGGIPGHISRMAHDQRSGITAALFQNSCTSDTTSFYRAGIQVPYEAVFRAAGA